MAIDKKTNCYISSFEHRSMDPILAAQGISKGIISFAVPDFGVLFRCQSEGNIVDMEFSAFFSLLEFIRSKLKNEKIQSVQLFSSNPHFVFSFSSYSDRLKEGTAYRQLLNEFTKVMTVSVGYIKPLSNKALISPADYPSIPQDKNVRIAFSQEELHKTEFKPIQKGVKL